MGDETGIRTKGKIAGDKYNSTDGQHRQGAGGPSGDASGTRSVPDSYRVGQERGGELAPGVPGKRDAGDDGL